MGATAPGPCPVSGQGLAAETSTAPFCTPRCQWVDLGRWLDGHYVFSSHVFPSNVLPSDVVPGEDAVGLDAIFEYEMRKGQEERADAGD